MPKPLSYPTIQTYRLDKWDPSGETYVTVREARQEEHELHSNLFAETSRIWDNDDSGGGVRLMQRVSSGEVMRTEVFLTLVDSNIVNADGDPLFACTKDGAGRPKLNMNSNQFRHAWGQLPAELAEEIHEKVLLTNPQWGREGKAG